MAVTSRFIQLSRRSREKVEKDETRTKNNVEASCRRADVRCSCPELARSLRGFRIEFPKRAITWDQSHAKLDRDYSETMEKSAHLVFLLLRLVSMGCSLIVPVGDGA